MNYNLSYIWPELILAVGGILTLVVGLGARSRTTPKRLGLLTPEVISLLVLIAAFVPAVMLMRNGVALRGVSQFVTGGEGYGMLAVDGLAVFFKIIAILSTAIVVLLSFDYFRGTSIHRGEYYALLVFATLAVTTLAASTDLVMIYLSLEFLSLASYILTGYLKRDPKSNEAALKYFLYGSIAAAVMIYGMSMLYGLTGSTNIYTISHALTAHPANRPLMFLSTLLVLAGFGFKVSMVPFHQWAPDTYEGAPTPVTAFLSVGSKAAGFAVLIRVLGSSITTAGVFDWSMLIIVLAGLTMTVGNLMAIPQTNAKRMLAYSSIAQAGYLLLGVAAIGVASTPQARTAAVQGILLYIFAYLFMNLGAFGVVTLLGVRLGSDEMSDYAGLAKRAPWAAAAMLFFMLSLAGIPPTAGFLGKFYLFFAAIKTAQQAGSSALLWLSVIAVANTVVSVYYYFNIVRIMYFGEPKNDKPVIAGSAMKLVLGLTFAMTILVLIFSPTFVEFARQSATMLAGI